MCSLLFFKKFTKFSAISPLNTFSALFFWCFHYADVGVLNGFPHTSEGLIILVHPFFLYLLTWIISHQSVSKFAHSDSLVSTLATLLVHNVS